MRDAITFVEQNGNFLGERQDELASRLKTPYTTRVQRAVRLVLTRAETHTPRETVESIAEVANEYGLTIPHPPVPLPPASPEDIYLVCWTAILGRCLVQVGH